MLSLVNLWIGMSVLDAYALYEHKHDLRFYVGVLYDYHDGFYDMIMILYLLVDGCM